MVFDLPCPLVTRIHPISTISPTPSRHGARSWALPTCASPTSTCAHAEAGLQAWLDAGHHGEMDYMASHGMKRARPAELVPGTVRVISARMDYLPTATPADWRARERLRQQDPQAAVVSLYARGRDYHKVLRNRLQQLAERIRGAVGDFGYRVFTDSAPVMELPLAREGRPGLARQAHPAADRAKRARRSSSARSWSTCRCRSMRRPAPTAASARPASTSARRMPSSAPAGWMRGAAFPT